VRVVSADWVVPVDGPPVADGAIAVDDDRIVAVGTSAELGSDTHYPEAVVLPGFVNAHSHLEYAVYAGFGDGLAFAPWLSVHISRKARLDLAGRLLGRPGPSKASVAEVGRLCGFADAAHFSRAFHAHHGVPPRSWREQGS